MRVKSRLLSVVFVSATFPFLSVGAAQANEMCTVKTARQSVSTETLCSCQTVDARMLRYIQRRPDFDDILARTLEACPAFAAVLTDIPTAAIGNSQRSGDGPANNDPSFQTASDDSGGGGTGGGSGGGNDGGSGGGSGGGSSPSPTSGAPGGGNNDDSGDNGNGDDNGDGNGGDNG
ncbi:hypothetical protein, partial [Ruegeria sp. HKCCA5491]|uniref:hypothetical protein n=1 Tax=Ruegeria sp. HKCCA5491 TaxID=2682986 RepID=UPI00148A02DC